uniref:Astacin domain-containing protein n=1 Tax=Parastrongyloides trichosuri TaxID=131310 RepID=A0A0N4ZDV1_PARTI
MNVKILLLILLSILLIGKIESSKRYKENIERLRGLINGGKSLTNIMKERRPEKTKRYKCVEIFDDENEVIPSLEQISPPQMEGNDNVNSFPINEEVPNNKFVTFKPIIPYTKENQKYITIPKETTESIQFILTTMKPEQTTSSSNDITNETKMELKDVPKDSNNRPLLLAPEHCKMIKKYADMYMVKNIRQWAHNHCSFAKMYLPTATCDEIDILVDSCFRQKFINE